MYEMERAGFIAQELRKHIPAAVQLSEGVIGGSNVSDFHRIDYDYLTTISVGALQELHLQIQSLKSDVDAIKNKIGIN